MESSVILVLDDEPGIMLLCKRLLTRAGFEVLAFTEPRKAMAELELRPVDLLLVDIRMPEVDGFELLRRVRERHPSVEMRQRLPGAGP